MCYKYRQEIIFGIEEEYLKMWNEYNLLILYLE